MARAELGERRGGTCRLVLVLVGVGPGCAWSWLLAESFADKKAA